VLAWFFVQVVLRKLHPTERPIVGRMSRSPRRGASIVIEFGDGVHEYVTTPVQRLLRVVGRDVFYVATVNSRYRLEVRGRVRAVGGASSR
jgi:hypothetical protein